VVSIPGTTKTFTRGQLRAQKETMDWHPEDRQGAIPDIARFGKQGVRQCTLCHLPDGSGRPENAPISAYHPTYFMQQMQDFRDGLRKSADPRKANTNVMIGFAKATTREEDLAAAEYFAKQPYPRRIKVVESKTAPKVRLQGGMHMAVPANEGGGQVPIPADEIVEIPDDNLAPKRAIRACRGQPMCCLARSTVASSSPRSISARPAMARTCKGSVRCRPSRAARRATPCGSCST
jgi:cytochrome c553